MPAALRANGLGTTDGLPPCDALPDNAAPPLPCNPVLRIGSGCAGSADPAREDFSAMGKPGREISRARQKVLEILETENSCSAWYRSKDSNPAATFRTLTFALDLEGDVFVRVTNEEDGRELVRSPYVASVNQGDGPHATVILNRNGAFFFPMATAREEARNGGPLILHLPRKLQVGPYLGGTLSAQVATMLHEFGHVLELLPPDHGDYEGKSRQNTAEMLRFCRAQVESK